jgi:hypothetical protein
MSAVAIVEQVDKTFHWTANGARISFFPKSNGLIFT